MYFWFWYSRLAAQVPVTLADKVVEAMETAPLAGCKVRPAFATRFGCMKLSVLPLSNNAFTSKFPRLIVAVDFDRDPEYWVVLIVAVDSDRDPEQWVVAITGKCTDADTLEVALL